MNRMYFIGVTTGQSSIQTLFPKIARLAGVRDAELKGIDIRLGGSPAEYIAAMQEIAEDDECGGALVTTHKVNLLRHAGSFFNSLDEDAALLGEVSCIVKRGAALAGIAVDPVTSMMAYDDMGAPSGDVLIFGAGGAAAAFAVALKRRDPKRRLVLTDISAERICHVQRLTGAEVWDAGENERVLSSMPAGTFVVNATGMGKDLPGSPVSESAIWPENCVAWDFNYRGDLAFLRYAKNANARVYDGTEYFLHGWIQIMSRAYGFKVTGSLMQQVRLAAGAKSQA